VSPNVHTPIQEPLPDHVALERLIGFGRYLRAGGLPVGTGRILSFCRAAAALDPLDRTDLHLAARTTLVSRHEDFAQLDDAFDRYFGSGDLGLISEEVPQPAPKAARDQQGGVIPEESVAVTAARWAPARDEEEPEGESAIRIVASDVERLRKKDFAELTQEERRAARARLRRLALLTPIRPSRRYRQARDGQRFDLRRTLRRSLRTEGEPFHRAWKKRQSRRRPLVLILDVSGSMAPYSRPLVEFAHAAAHAGRRVEVFCFGTRLTRITRALKTRDPEQAIAAVGATVSDWEGGTRIGESLKELLDRWSARTALRGSVVVLCSDGLERGDPQLLAAQMARLSRLAHRLLWLNPLKGSPRYEPLARGMAVSLPYVNVFLPGHNLESLEALASALTQA
jgi:uncharacterized protein with von Willebrand factor type A (vWA) domain